MDLFETPQGKFQLQRFPLKSHPSLRAWDAADELLLNHLHEIRDQLPPNPTVWIVNDSFGALSITLHSWHPSCYSDSHLCLRALENNHASNDLYFDPEQFVPAHVIPEGKIDLLLIKVPKTLALLEHQLSTLRPMMNSETVVIGAGMAKHIHRSTLDLFESKVGATKTSLARKKARLIFSEIDTDSEPTASPYPSQYQLKELGLTLSNHANVFCRERLDIGTRLFLEQLPSDSRYKDIVDLGCGNGVVGLVAAQKNPQADIHFVDESYMAVDSARTNWEHSFGDSANGHFKVDNCLDLFPKDSADLILNNPPFHQQQAIGDHIAWQMFSQSLRSLRKDGELWVIGNRHLGYHVKLKKLFGNCITVASNKKFVVLKSVKK